MKDIIVLGHVNPDVDSILSGIILSKYLIYKGYKASYLIPDKNIDKETKVILESFKIDFTEYQGELNKDSSLILVDHYETDYKNQVVAVIDHHPTSKKFDYPIYINKKSSSTAKLIYDIINKNDKDFLDKDIIELIIVATMVDTCSFKSSKTNKEDIQWSIDMCNSLSLDYNTLINIGYCLTDLSNPNDSSLNGFKQFVYNEKIVKTSYIQCDNFYYNKIQEHLNILFDKIKKEDIYMWMFMVIDVKNEKTIEYRIYKNKINEIYHEGIVSRGTTIMPIIEKLLIN